MGRGSEERKEEEEEEEKEKEGKEEKEEQKKEEKEEEMSKYKDNFQILVLRLALRQCDPCVDLLWLNAWKSFKLNHNRILCTAFVLCLFTSWARNSFHRLARLGMSLVASEFPISPFQIDCRKLEIYKPLFPM